MVEKFDVCVKCAVGVSEAVRGKCQMSATAGVRSGCVVIKRRVIAGAECNRHRDLLRTELLAECGITEAAPQTETESKEFGI